MPTQAVMKKKRKKRKKVHHVLPMKGLCLCLFVTRRRRKRVRKSESGRKRKRTFQKTAIPNPTCEKVPQSFSLSLMQRQMPTMTNLKNRLANKPHNSHNCKRTCKTNRTTLTTITQMLLHLTFPVFRTQGPFHIDSWWHGHSRNIRLAQ